MVGILGRRITKAWAMALAMAALCAGCAVTRTGPVSRAPGGAVMVIDDAALRTEFLEKAAPLLKDETHTSMEKLKEQLARTSCPLALPTPGTREMTPAEIYRRRMASVLMVSVFYHCKSPTCVKLHSSNATGVVLREDGVMVTNYHVVNSDKKKLLGMCAMTVDGRVFTVDEVLAADKVHDVAIVKLKDAEGLQAAGLSRDEPVGNPVTLISHPKGKFYTLTQGWVSRYHVEKDKGCVMSVTADYAVGSSGGPAFNSRGNLVGIASTTQSIFEPKIPLGIDPKTKALSVMGMDKEAKAARVNGQRVFMGLNPQMTIKDAVPSRAILDLVEE